MAPIVGRARWYRGGRDGAIAQLGERVVRNDEVGGSIPPGSTSLRSLRELRLGKPMPVYRSEVSEGCHAIARRATAGLGLIRFYSLRELRLGKPYANLS
jgi:hypothetical protein